MTINSITGNTALESGSFPPVRVASTGSPLTPTTGGLLVVDGVQLIAGDRVLCKDESSAVNNGIYAANTGPWTRTTDASTNQQFFSGMAVTVGLGAVNAGLTYLCTTTDDPVVVGTSLITFAAQSTVATATQTATSTTSFLIGTGSKAFTTQAGKAFAVNQWVIVQETSNPANQMFGQVTAYSGTTLTVNVTATGGSGTHADWTIVLNNSAAAAGYSPPVGTGNVTGPGSSTTGNAATFADTTGKVLKDGGAPIGAANTVTPSMFATQAAALGCNMLNGEISVTAAAGVLQCAVKTLAGTDPSASDPVFCVFRDATANSGKLTIIEVTAALSLTVPSTQVLGTAGFATNTPGKLWFVATNNSGTVALAAINCLSGTSIFALAGQGIGNISAMGASGSNSAQTFYGQATVASLPYSVIGYASWEAPLTMTAGTWITPSRVETYRPGVPLPGQEVQRVRNTTGAFATGTTTVSSFTADTVPTSAMGDQYMSQAITATSSANLFEIESQIYVQGGSSSTRLGSLLLQDSTVNSLVAEYVNCQASELQALRLSHQMLAATLSATTFKVRAGGDQAGTNTFNGVAGARTLGGAFNSFLQVREIMA